MFVKKYYQFQCSVNALENRKDYWWEDPYDEYEKSDYSYSKCREAFIEQFKREISEATFSYFPELKGKEDILKPGIEEILEGDIVHWLYERIFDVILGYYHHKKLDWEEEKWSYRKIHTEEELLEEAEEFICKYEVEPEFIESTRSSIINATKNTDHIFYYEQVVHKAILRCVTNVFEEVFEMSAKIIRYINYITFINAGSLSFV